MIIKHINQIRLDLPEYKSYEELRSKLVTAIEESSGFDGVDWFYLLNKALDIKILSTF